jgi:hypothetical protein
LSNKGNVTHNALVHHVANLPFFCPGGYDVDVCARCLHYCRKSSSSPSYRMDYGTGGCTPSLSVISHYGDGPDAIPVHHFVCTNHPSAVAGGPTNPATCHCSAKTVNNFSYLDLNTEHGILVIWENNRGCGHRVLTHRWCGYEPGQMSLRNLKTDY